jgi:hypothetical protein
VARGELPRSRFERREERLVPERLAHLAEVDRRRIEGERARVGRGGLGAARPEGEGVAKLKGDPSECARP